ncbi:hypothetical protein EV137_3886 [Kribbella pratensis]|uniref:Uncharacterized protein n=1 Tax=Kribbella pratensis TaxID=2512112 RepID=A0ABY2FFC3_9ACTN|nr:hypothetical protein [Kribbella pratensis]TDW90079.1 hypothetical protein EV137_3886 [Kribbella pratensis]
MPGRRYAGAGQRRGTATAAGHLALEADGAVTGAGCGEGVGRRDVARGGLLAAGKRRGAA